MRVVIIGGTGFIGPSHCEAEDVLLTEMRG
jgi:hypothetical protein